MAKPRARKAKEKDEVSDVTADLIAALKFVNIANSSNGRPYDQHVILHSNWAVASDGVLAAGYPIPDDIQAYPHTEKLIAALLRCGKSLSMTSGDASMTIRSGKFSVSIPVMPPDAMLWAMPDPMAGVADDELRKGLEIVGTLVSDTAQLMVNSTVCINGGSVVATDRLAALEYWHGNNMPPMVVIPKTAVNAVCRPTSPLVGIGYTPERSITFYYENKAWIKTQLHIDPYPDIWRILNRPINCVSIPPSFFDGVETIAPFADNSQIYLQDKMIRTSMTDGVGATYEIEEIEANKYSFSAKYMKLLASHMKYVDWKSHDGLAYFTGERIRGVVAGRETN